jgi:hypothetical protein
VPPLLALATVVAEDAAASSSGAGDSLTVEGQRFAIVPEWVIDADIGDCAFRLYAVLLRYGQSSGVRMPSRATLARRLRKRSVDTVDRAMKELVAAGAVVVERRRDGKQNLTNRYHVRTSGPGRTDAATSSAGARGRSNAGTGQVRAATPDRTDPATPAAAMRPDPEPLTQEQPPPTVEQLAGRCLAVRRAAGLPVLRWTTASVASAVARCRQRGWPEELIAPALERVAQDPSTRSPFRTAEAGPWWDELESTVERPSRTAEEQAELTRLEEELDACDGLRAHLQREAREQLTVAGIPLTKATVIRRAVELLRERGA